jgi:hypothetical protein
MSAVFLPSRIKFRSGGNELKKVEKRERDIPLNNPINLIRFPTSLPHFSNDHIRVDPLPK